jgi:competence protein ComEA
MSFYRSLLAAVAAVAIASPVFADDAAATNSTNESNQAVQVNENANAAPAASEEKAAASAESVSADQAKVNLNKATVKELAKVKGLNVSKAKSVVAYRKKHGDFKSTDELSNVKGFKKLKPEALKEIADQLTVE